MKKLLEEAIELKKKHGQLSNGLLRRNFKLSYDGANTLLENIYKISLNEKESLRLDCVKTENIYFK